MGVLVQRVEHTQGEWDRQGYSPVVTGWGGLSMNRLTLTQDDNSVINLHAQETTGAATTQDINLTGGTTFRFIVRASKDSSSAIYAYSTQFNQSYGGAVEDLVQGKVATKFGVGPIAYTLTNVDDGSPNTFMIGGDYTAQFSSGNELTIAGSTGNDGTYTITGTPTYSAGTGHTTIAVTEDIPNATVDGNLTHSALQNVAWDTDNGYIGGFLEISWLTPVDSDNQTLLPAFPVRIHRKIDASLTGVTAGSAPDTFSSTEVEALLEDRAYNPDSGSVSVIGTGTHVIGTTVAGHTFIPLTVTALVDSLTGTPDTIDVKLQYDGVDIVGSAVTGVLGVAGAVQFWSIAEAAVLVAGESISAVITGASTATTHKVTFSVLGIHNLVP